MLSNGTSYRRSDRPSRCWLIRNRLRPRGGTAASTCGLLLRELPSVAIIPIPFAENRVNVAEPVQAWNDRLEKAVQQRSA